MFYFLGEALTGQKVEWFQLAQITMTILFPIITLLVGWIGNTVTKNYADIASLKKDLENQKENAYTHNNADEDRKDLYASINEIKSMIHKLELDMPTKESREQIKTEIAELRTLIIQGRKN